MPEREILFSARRPWLTFCACLGLFVAAVGIGVASYLLSGGPL